MEDRLITSEHGFSTITNAGWIESSPAPTDPSWGSPGISSLIRGTTSKSGYDGMEVSSGRNMILCWRSSLAADDEGGVWVSVVGGAWEEEGGVVLRGSMMTERVRVGPKAVHSLWMRFQVLCSERGEREHHYG